MISEVVKNFYLLAADQIRSARRILAVTHINPDGDALGSLCFFKELTLSLNKDCALYCAGPLPTNLEFLPHYLEIITDKNKLNFAEFDLFVSLDCATVGRTDLDKELAQRHPDQHFLEIDHHAAIKTSSDSQLRISSAASTTEILFHLASVMAIAINPLMAKTLLTGIVTDTANFVHPNATQNTVAAAALIAAQGANLAKINDQTFRTKTLAGLRLWGVALARLTKVPKFNLVYTVLTAEDFAQHQVVADDIEGLSGFLSSLSEADIILFLLSIDGNIRGSFRTIKQDVDVARLAQIFGGGGHVKAAGFSFPGKLVLVDGYWRAVKP